MTTIWSTEHFCVVCESHQQKNQELKLKMADDPRQMEVSETEWWERYHFIQFIIIIFDLYYNMIR